VTPPTRVPRGALVATFLRSFSIQGSWNYHTLVGNGFAFALLPVLKAIARGDDRELERGLCRHAELFNAHPYLSAVALGATARLEADGEDPEVIRRFKAAIRGPLGALGDALVWAAWLPVTLLLALVFAFLGAAPWVSVLLFLVLYNIGHVGLRFWGFRAGLAAGKDVGLRLRAAHLGPAADRIARWGAVLLGALAGVLVSGERGFGAPLWLWGPLAVGAFVAGLAGGQRAWRPAAFSVVAAVGFITLSRMMP